MTDLREKVVRAILSIEQKDGAPWAVSMADAAIKALLEAVPTGDMLQAGNRVWLDGGNEREIFEAMVTAFRRDHYLSALAEEDGKLIE